jgi:hypothetical protein
LEPALGGPDTTTRARTVWQVRCVPLLKEEQCEELYAPGWFAPDPRLMAAGLRPPEDDPDPCRITTTGGYERLENQLYRVQVHAEASGDAAATFVWSRENGSVVARVLSLAPGRAGTFVLEVDRAGRDDELAFHEQQLVEVTSPDRELRGEPGFLARTGAPVGLTLPVTWLAAAPGSLDDVGRLPVVRRWEGGELPLVVGETDLEAGITVRFPEGGVPRTGDYWQIPARTVRLAYGLSRLSGTIEWPPDPNEPVEQRPAGPVHHYAPLAILRREDGGWTLESDCRRLFPPLTRLPARRELRLLGGDGQEVGKRGAVVSRAVRVVADTALGPAAGARVVATAGDQDTGFGLVADAAAGGATPGTLAGTGGQTIEVLTDAAGVAALWWQPEFGNGTSATLDIALSGAPDAPVRVTSQLDQGGGERTPGMHVKDVTFAEPPGTPFENDSDVRADVLASGIVLELDRAPLPASVEGKPVMRVILELPWPLSGEDHAVWADGPIGYREVIVESDCSAKENELYWLPTQRSQNWLRHRMWDALAKADLNRVTGWLVVEGWAIVDAADQNLHLNGHVRTESQNGQTTFLLPTDDEIAGGVLKQWFRIVR